MKNNKMEKKNNNLGKSKIKYIIFIAFIIGVLCILFKFKDRDDPMIKYNNDKWLITSLDKFTYKEKVGQVDDNGAKLNYNMGGIETMWKFTVEDSTDIKLQCNHVLNNGKAKLILITPSNKVQNICEGTVDDVYTLHLLKGTNRIRFVGNKAVGNIKLEVTYGNNVKVETIES